MILIVTTHITMGVGHAKPLSNLENIERIKKQHILIDTSAGEKIEIAFLNDKVFRLWVAANGKFTDEGSGSAKIVEQTPSQNVDLHIELIDKNPKKTYHLIKTNYLALRVYPTPLTFSLYKQDNKTLIWKELKPIEIDEKGSYQTLASDETLRFFGGGQQNGQFEFHNSELNISYSGGWEEGDRPSPAPFYMTQTGYGVLRNTWKNGVYDFRSSDYLTTLHKEERFDAYYFNGENINEVLAQYTGLTGRAKLLPRWAFEYGDADCYNDGDNIDKPGTVPADWHDGTTGKTMDVVSSVAKKYREHDMPGGWILPNDGYGCGYEELPEVVSNLAKYGFKTGLWTESGVEKIAWEVGSAGSRAQKLDVAWTGKGYQFSLDANQAAAQGIINHSDSRPFIWTVMGWAGTQRYAVTWTGDQSGSWDYIRWHIPTLIGSGLSGQVYATGDVDGIFGGSPETFTRDLQWKSFTPVLMGMSGWSKSSRKHPWWFEEPYRSINRQYLKLKMRLMPYMYTYAHLAETQGSPIIRGLMWDFPDDPHAFSEEYPYQFLLGKDFLIAPVYQSQSDSRGWREKIYLPQGQWIDYWDGRVLNVGKKGKVIDYQVDLQTTPVFVRGGAIIPMYPESLYDAQIAKDRLTLDLYPYGDSEFSLYEDDGNSRQYQQGAFSQQLFKMTAPKHASGDILFEMRPMEGSYLGIFEKRYIDLMVHTRIKPENIYLGKNVLKKFTQKAQFDQASEGWFFDSQKQYGVLLVKLGQLNMRRLNQVKIAINKHQQAIKTKGYQKKPKGDRRIISSSIKIVSRPTEEPGYPLENAFDQSQDSWFRSVRDYSAQTGPHELVLSLGSRKAINGIELSPRNDKHWKYGQVRDYEIYMGDINGEWGEAIAVGRLEPKKDKQRIEFKTHTGRLLRLRILSTQEQGTDPMVLATQENDYKGAYNAFAPVKVNPITLSEISILESPLPDKKRLSLFLSESKWQTASNQLGPVERDLSNGLKASKDGAKMRMNGLTFNHGLGVYGDSQIDFKLTGNWQLFRADSGIDDSCREHGDGRFQVYADGDLIFDSGTIKSPAVVKPELDIRGVELLSLRTVAGSNSACMNWANAKVIGFIGDKVGD